ncbi:2-keto-4-pentenoate hydratase [Halobaculum sp. P14]|uniref:2-keto-4-pentenoate hydratase n=1 Tax=Halobaculum sp. P14 TaxID=3421638 RepID=UPI003EBE2015
MGLSQSEVDSFADELYDAYVDKEPVTPLSEDTEFTTDEAYEIQSAVVDRVLAGDNEVIGRKLGLVSEAKQEQIGIDEPIFGTITEENVLDGPIPTEEMISPRLEAEIGLVLDDDLPAPVSTTDVLTSTRALVPVVELIESRYKGWSIPSAQDVIADNTSTGKLVVGETLRDVTDVDLPHEGVTVTVNGDIEATGVGADIMGNPARAVAWLGDRLADLDQQLREGDLVMTGGISAALDVEPNDVYTVEFGNIGSVHLRAE